MLWEWFTVLLIALAMLSILVLAAGVVVYVAFPHRGEPMPVTPWLGQALGRAVESLPTGSEPEDFYETTGQRRA